jgi:hypothetical protein
MPHAGLPDGLYLAKQLSARKRVDHFGIIDVGNRLGHPSVRPGDPPVVVHRTSQGLRLQWLHETDPWPECQHIVDEAGAMERIREAFKDHFARFVASGKKHSIQVQAGLFVVGLAALFALS